MSDNSLVLTFCLALQTLSDSYSTKKKRKRKLCREQDLVGTCMFTSFKETFRMVSSRKHLRTKIPPDLHLKYSKTGGNLGLVLKR